MDIMTQINIIRRVLGALVKKTCSYGSKIGVRIIKIISCSISHVIIRRGPSGGQGAQRKAGFFNTINVSGVGWQLYVTDPPPRYAMRFPFRIFGGLTSPEGLPLLW